MDNTLFLYGIYFSIYCVFALIFFAYENKFGTGLIRHILHPIFWPAYALFKTIKWIVKKFAELILELLEALFSALN